jgi:hypothetical protein
MRRLILIPAALLAVAIASIAGPGVSVGGPLTVNLSCSDGTNLDLALDTAAVTQLSDAVTAINLYPAGDPPLTCSLTQSAVTSSSTVMGIPLMRASSASASGTPNGPHDYAVGGGQFFNQFIGCQENFAISAHTPDDAALTPNSDQPGAGGTGNFGFPGSCSNPTWAGSRIVSKVDCVQVSGTTANFTAEITKSTGNFPTFFGGAFAVGKEIAFQVKDLGPVFADEIIANSAGVGTHPAGACNFTATATAMTFSIDHGNISVHEATP